MSDTADFLYRLLGAVLFLALVASVLMNRRLTGRAPVSHDPKTCAECAFMRHLSNRTVRVGLTALPRQTRGGGQ